MYRRSMQLGRDTSDLWVFPHAPLRLRSGQARTLPPASFYRPNLLGIPSQPPGIVALVFSPPQAQQ